jgi:hypothetical protein
MDLRSYERHGPRQTAGPPLTRKDGPDLLIRGALGGTRTPNLLIHSPVPIVQPVRSRSSAQIRVDRESEEYAWVRCQLTSL